MCVQLLKVETFGHTLVGNTSRVRFQIKVYVSNDEDTKRYIIGVVPNFLKTPDSPALLQASQSLYKEQLQSHIYEILQIVVQVLRGHTPNLPQTLEVPNDA